MQFTVTLPEITEGADNRKLYYGWLQQAVHVSVTVDQKTITINTSDEYDFAIIVNDCKGRRLVRTHRCYFSPDGTPLGVGSDKLPIKLSRGAASSPKASAAGVPSDSVEDEPEEPAPVKSRRRTKKKEPTDAS